MNEHLLAHRVQKFFVGFRIGKPFFPVNWWQWLELPVSISPEPFIMF